MIEGSAEKMPKIPVKTMKLFVFSLITLISFVFLSHFAMAEATTIVSEYFYTDDTFILNDKIGIVNVNSYDEVVIDYNNGFIVVRNNTCSRVVNNVFCVDSIEYDNTVDKKKAELSVYYIGPDITITRSINKSNPLVDEGVKITVKIKNDGNSSAENLTYIDIFPPEIKVIDIIKGHAKIEKVLVLSNDTGVRQNMTRVFWQGKILVGYEERIDYVIKPKAAIDSTFTAKAIYSDGLVDVEKITSAITIKTGSFFEVFKKFAPIDYTVAAGSITLTGGESKADLQIGEEMLFILEIDNKVPNNESINLSYVDIHIPGGVIYEGPATFRVYTNTSNANESYLAGMKRLKSMGKNVYRWSGLVGPDDFALAIKLKGTKEGTKRIVINAQITRLADKKKPYYEPIYTALYDNYEEIEVKIKKPVIESNFKSGQTFESGQSAYFTVYMQNENEYANFTDMKVVIESPWTTKNITFSNIKKTNYVNFFDGFVTMPPVAASTSAKFSVNATFRTEYGDVYSAKLERSITIKPHSPLQFSHTFTPSKGGTLDKIIIDNTESVVLLKAINTAAAKIDHINLTEVIDPALNSEGNMTRILNIDKGATMDVLQYKIDPPDLKEIKQYRITTYMDYVSSNETYHVIKDIIVEVNPKKLTLSIEKSVQEDIASMGTPFYVDYDVENKAGEELENITILFPITEDSELIGNRHYTINRLGKDEKISITGKEKRMAKTDTTSLKLGKTKVVFHDKNGNEFEDNSTIPTVEVLYKPLQTPLLYIRRNVSKTTVNQLEEFTVTTTVVNSGAKPANVSISDMERAWELQLDPGKEKPYSYQYGEERTGEVKLEPAVASYVYGGEMHYTASNNNEITVVGAKKEEKAPGAAQLGAAETPPAGVSGEAATTEEKIKSAYAKYLYLVIFIVIICMIILSVIRVKPKEKRFDFLEK